MSAEIGQCNEKLLNDDEVMEMDDEERAALGREIKALEQEFGYWCKIFSGRMQEKRVGGGAGSREAGPHSPARPACWTVPTESA